MVMVEPDEVFKDANGHPVLNGAGGVKKLKTVGERPRFSSVLSQT